MEELKTNAVQCSNCGTNNPKFYIKCKKCGKKLDLSDKRIFDENIDRKSTNTKWTPASFIIFSLVFGTLFYFGIKVLRVGNHDSSSATTELPDSNIGSYGTLSKEEFIAKVKENQAIVDADITDVDYLYISVVNDGNNKDAMASYYCRLARQYNVGEVKTVKIVDAATAYLPKNGTAAGKELGKSFCK